MPLSGPFRTVGKANHGTLAQRGPVFLDVLGSAGGFVAGRFPQRRVFPFVSRADVRKMERNRASPRLCHNQKTTIK